MLCRRVAFRPYGVGLLILSQFCFLGFGNLRLMRRRFPACNEHRTHTQIRACCGRPCACAAMFATANIRLPLQTSAIPASLYAVCSRVPASCVLWPQARSGWPAACSGQLPVLHHLPATSVPGAATLDPHVGLWWWDLCQESCCCRMHGVTQLGKA